MCMEKKVEVRQDTAPECPWAVRVKQGLRLAAVSFFLVIWTQPRALTEFPGGGYCFICICFFVVVGFWLVGLVCLFVFK